MRGPAQHLWQVRAAPGLCRLSVQQEQCPAAAALQAWGWHPSTARKGSPEPPQSSLMGGLEARWENSTQEKKKEELGGKP